jgi:type III restriction enzyme
MEQAAASFVMEANRDEFVAAAKAHAQAVDQIFSSPAERGVKLAVPMFCVQRQGVLELLDETHFLERPWNLRDYVDRTSTETAGEISIGEQNQAAYGEIGLSEQGKVRWKFGRELADELRLIEVSENWSEARLIDWVDRNIPHPDVSADDSGLFISAVLTAYLQRGGLPLGRLVRERFALRDDVEARINTCRREAKAKAFQAVMFAEEIGPITVTAQEVFTFDPDRYPARWTCERSADFRKHYHRQVGELAEKGEEFECALFLDQLPEVEVWLRNLERQPERSFWLPTATDRFYPDFVCKLADGRILVVEYKGEDRWSNDDSKEKRRLGELWAERSEGHCLFVMPCGKDFPAIRKQL